MGQKDSVFSSRLSGAQSFAVQEQEQQEKKSNTNNP